MLSYLQAEINYLRAFGNRSLLLILLCALTRSGQGGKASVVGVTIDINPAIIVVFGPILALLLLVFLKGEGDNLLLARELVLAEASTLKRYIARNRWPYILFVVPAAAAIFMTMQFILKVAPNPPGCEGWSWIKHLSDFSFVGGTPSIYCIGSVTEGAPWIYPPLQLYLYVLCVVGCIYLTAGIIRAWPRVRGGAG